MVPFEYCIVWVMTTVQLGSDTAVTPRILARTFTGVVLVVGDPFVVLGGTVVGRTVVDGHGLANLRREVSQPYSGILPSVLGVHCSIGIL